ncbi:hypothetical protein [Flavivirga jejuensis]|uniref:Uncharacterized protein n=1 Tax=Flavivirga jejuensis TaxID=870487 RepID=A0ABT8WS89_9FLAO|nr:hypothetical protein [Flavivirga jejuensis]MDO5975974.1 hypothetical protein [Flavivirga jejuensis]
MSINKICYYILLSIFVFGCSNDSSILSKIKVEELEGLDRTLEYIEVRLPPLKTYQEDYNIYVYSKNNKENVRAQIVDLRERKKDDRGIKIIFPISIRGNETKEYSIKAAPDKYIKTDNQMSIMGDGLNLMFENKYFSASFKEYVGHNNEKLGYGHLGSILLKEFDNVVLERKDPNLKIHWAPSFGRENLNYRTMAHITEPDSTFISTKGPYCFSLFKSGYIEGYEKISLKGEYTFYAGLPYFIFNSKITFMDSDTLNLLRNDEMTMDSLFTHVVFPKPSGKTIDLPLYSETTMTYLKEDPITDDAPWLFFYNKSKSYAFGSIRLDYDNKNIYGNDSPTENRHTKISTSANSGRYWNRRLINSKNTLIPKGSMYREKNAYIVFKVDKDDPAKTIKHYYKCLKSPVKVSKIN